MIVLLHALTPSPTLPLQATLSHFSGNSAAHGPGGVTHQTFSTVVSFVNCTFYGNSAEDGGLANVEDTSLFSATSCNIQKQRCSASCVTTVCDACSLPC